MLGEGSLLLAALILADRAALRRQAVGTLIVALVVGPIVGAGGPPLGGWFSASALSYMHVLAWSAIGLLAGSLAGLDAIRPESSLWLRLARAAALSTGLLVFLLGWPAVRTGFAPALDYLAVAGDFTLTYEQQHLYRWLRKPAGAAMLPAFAFYGGLAYLIPIVPLVLGWAAVREPDRRGPLVVLSGSSPSFSCVGATTTRRPPRSASRSSLRHSPGSRRGGRHAGSAQPRRLW